jgi:transposase
MQDGKNLKTRKKMGAVKEYYHDLIEEQSRNKDSHYDDDYQYQKYLADKKEETEYFHNLKLTKWQKLLIQLRAWRSQFISTITNYFRTKNSF